MIRSSSVLIAAALLVPLGASASFPDVPDSHPNAEAINYAQSYGIAGGYPDGTFRADARINRAEFAKIVASAYGAEEIASCRLKRDLGGMFPDMRADDWYAPYVCVANQHDILHGYPDGTFRGAADINFAEAAKMLTFRYNLYGDVTDVWYERGVRALAARGAIPLSIVSFDQKITRGEMAEMVYRLNAGITEKPSQTYELLVRAGQEQSYTDPAHVYTIRYPGWWSRDDDGGGMTLTLPLTHTSARFVTRATVRITLPQTCAVPDPSPGTIVQTVLLGGRPFTATEQREAAAGTLYDTIFFVSRLSPSRCLVLEKTITTGNALIEGEEDRVQALREEAAMQDALKAVLQTITVHPDGDGSLRTYTDEDLAFAVDYPSAFSVRQSGGEVIFDFPDNVRGSSFLYRDDVIRAWISVGTAVMQQRGFPGTAFCTGSEPEQTFNGQTFGKTHLDEHAMGGYYTDFTVYQIPHAGSCYQIVLAVEGDGPGAGDNDGQGPLPSDRADAASTARFFEEVERMLLTFRFTR